jgi:putative colanic acid biosynthesis acetyltransferase WcaF
MDWQTPNNSAVLERAGIAEESPRVDLSQPDNSDYVVGRSKLTWSLWHFFGSPIVRSNLLPFPALKAAVLRFFGASIGAKAHIKPGVKVKFPWYLTIGDYCWIGEDVWIDNLAPVIIGSHVCISQMAYLCTGNHDWKSANMKLFRRPIRLGDGCWVGARSTVCPGVTIGPSAIAAVGAIVTQDIPAEEVWAGNPARFIRKRVFVSSNA